MSKYRLEFVQYLPIPPCLHVWCEGVGCPYWTINYLNVFQDIENGSAYIECDQGLSSLSQYICVKDNIVIFSARDKMANGGNFMSPITLPLNECMGVFYELYYAILDRQ